MTIAASSMKQQSASRFGTRRMQDIETDTRAESAVGRALVIVEPAAPENARYVPIHPSAAFIAHLLAAKANLPQTRERRRAEPDEAAHSYQVSMTPRPPRKGRVLSRAM
jgi:hypothetical protein